MKYFSSFRTTVNVSRYLFRTLALLLWALGALLSLFYIFSVLHQRESDLRQDYDTSFELAQGYFRHSSDIMRQLKYIAENRLDNGHQEGHQSLNEVFSVNPAETQFYPVYPNADCSRVEPQFQQSAESLSYFLNYWKDNFSDAYDLNRVFYISPNSQCLTHFSLRNAPVGMPAVPKSLQRQIIKYHNTRANERGDYLYWVVPDSRPDSGYYYILTPVFVGNRLAALLAVELGIRLEDFASSSNLPIGITLLSDHNSPVMALTEGERRSSSLRVFPAEAGYFGYIDSYKDLVMKKGLAPATLSIVYSLPLNVVIDKYQSLILVVLLLNLFSGLLLFVLTWLFERKMFAPAEKNALQLEENEQFNRKIVASAPVGICILRISDGANLISNELAHNYLSLLTFEDRQRIIHIICGQQVNFVDVMTSNNNNLQISFVHSRYRNENVAICVLVDVSARVRMEESLQEMAAAAEQASQAKSMFLATVSHELRTPLYGIIGNLDLIKTKVLPEGVDRFVSAMSNSSALLLSIISDILDFSKIESEQLKIEPRDFSPREVVNHLAGNYLPLVVKKRLALYCFIDPAVPVSLKGDPVRLQQVLSNLLNNAIKFTQGGCIMLSVCCDSHYLKFCIRDTGVGIKPRELMRLFDPFVQLASGGERQFQGTGLGLAICEKLVSLMDGDINVESETGLGSLFTIRLPLYKARFQPTVLNADLYGRVCWLAIRNAALETYLTAMLEDNGLQVRRHGGESINAQDTFICDYDYPPTGTPRATVRFITHHIGHAEESMVGDWHMSSAFAEELPLVLLKIYRSDLAQPSLLTLPRPVNTEENADIQILVVDDHPINRRLLADQLSWLGYQAITANDGVDALNMISRHQIDIVLSDVNMPNMDGYELTRRIRSQGLSLPVVGVTANALAEEKQRCLDAGMDSCLPKPVTLEILQPALANYCQRIRLERHESLNY